MLRLLNCQGFVCHTILVHTILMLDLPGTETLDLSRGRTLIYMMIPEIQLECFKVAAWLSFNLSD